MSKRTRPALPAAVAELGRRVGQWRETRKKLSPMPAPLWAEAVTLAQFFGTAPVAREARLDYSNLKRRVAEAGPGGRPERAAAAARPSAFVEVMASAPPLPAEGVETTVELSAKDGARMVIRLQGGAGFDVEQLMAAFWRRESCSK